MADNDELRGRSRTRSPARSQSMKSMSRSPSRSRSRSRSKSRDRSVARSASPAGKARSRSPSRSRSRSRSYSRSISRSRSPYSRSRSPYSRSPSPRRRSPSPRRRSRSPLPARRGSDVRGNGRVNDDEERLRTIVVSHLTRNVTEKHLDEIFGAYGEIKRVEISKARIGNANRGFANVLYTTSADADKAVAYMDRGQLDGNLLAVSIKRREGSPPPAAPYGRDRFRDGPRGGDRYDRGPPLRRDDRYRPAPSYPDNRRGSGNGFGRPSGRDDFRRRGSRSPPPARRRDRSLSPRSNSRSRSPPRRRNPGNRRPSPTYR